jgi:hypothetical protein
VVLALALALVPRRSDLIGLAALSAAILIAVQLGVTYWFYLYIPWFFPLAMIALLGAVYAPVRDPELSSAGTRSCSIESARIA